MEAVKLFLDTNVVIDFYTGRQGDGCAEKVIQCCESGLYKACISVLTGVNTLYVTRKFTSRISMGSISELFEVLPMDSGQWIDAQEIGINDPEDAIQLACARRNGCRVMVTRDRHLLDLKDPGIRILTPEAFLDYFAIFD